MYINCFMHRYCIDNRLVFLWIYTCLDWGNAENSLCDICTLALFWFLQYLILFGYTMYTVITLTGRELL